MAPKTDELLNIADYLDKLPFNEGREIYAYFMSPLATIFRKDANVTEVEVGGVKFIRNNLPKGRFEILTNADKIESWDIEAMVEDMYLLCEKHGLLPMLEESARQPANSLVDSLGEEDKNGRD